MWVEQVVDNGSEGTDPRILRSRRMLMDALDALVKQKKFEEISIQEIADKATLNRNTFYLHYPDKNALLQALTQARFRDLLARRRVCFTGSSEALRAIALGVCDYLDEITSCPIKGALLPLESSIIPVLEAVFVEGVASRPAESKDDAALASTTAAWAVFGAARKWHEGHDRITAQKMAKKIEKMVAPIFSSRLA